MTDVSTAGNNTDTDPDWGARASAIFLDFVDSVRGKTTGPVLKIARALVYGLVILVAAAMLAIFALIALVRLVDVLLPGQVWSAYLLLSVLFLLAGIFCWSKRTP